MNPLTFLDVKYFGSIIGLILLLLLGVSFSISLLILAITWLVVFGVLKPNDESRNEDVTLINDSITSTSRVIESTQSPESSNIATKQDIANIIQSIIDHKISHELDIESHSESYYTSISISEEVKSGVGNIVYSLAKQKKSETKCIANDNSIIDVTSEYQPIEIAPETKTDPFATKQDIANIIQSIVNHKILHKLDIESYPKNYHASLSEEVKSEVDNLVYSLVEHKKSETKSIANDDSIIDVTGEYQPIKTFSEIETEPAVTSGKVPYWEKKYIYSTLFLNFYTNSEVKQFYKKYKESFLSGIYYDLQGNDNYAFTLMFDLLEEYDKSYNLTQITNQIQALIKYYPDTKHYAERELIQRAKLHAKRRAQCTIGETSLEDIIELYPDSHEWTFTEKYAEKLNLTPKEIIIFDFISHRQSLYYINIEFMLVKVVDLFRVVLHNLALKFEEENKTLENEFARIANLMSLKIYYYDERKDDTQRKINTIYDCIFKLCSNKLHQKYGFGYSDMDIYYSIADENRKILVANIMPLVRNILKESLNSLPELSDDEEIIVNEQYNTRWRPKFQKIMEIYNNDLSYFIEAVNRLAKQNSKNNGVGYLLFDTAKCLVGKDNIAALKFYLRYVDAYRKFSSDTEKPLPKYICKKLFKKAEQQEEFEEIVRQYKEDGDSQKAHKAIDQLFLPKRKKLNLDHKQIDRISEQHSETVQLLNDAMSEDEMELQRNVVDLKNNINNPIQQTNVLLDLSQKELLDIFVRNNHSLTKSQVADFAKSRGLMVNRLIEKINELCYDTLDDVLIEDEGDNWTISEDYLKKI